MTKLNHELETTKQDRDLWKTRYINRCSLRKITTIERAVTESDKWQHTSELEVDSNPLSPAYSDMSSTEYSPKSL